MHVFTFARLIWVRILVMGLVAFCLLGAVRAFAVTNVQIFLYNGSGGVTNVTSVDEYLEPHVIEIATGQQIGTVDPQTDDIYDSSNNLIGYISL